MRDKTFTFVCTYAIPCYYPKSKRKSKRKSRRKDSQYRRTR